MAAVSGTVGRRRRTCCLVAASLAVSSECREASEGGLAAGRCLEESPQLTNPSLQDIMIETHTWASSQLSSAILRILVEEYLGYKVTMNQVPASNHAGRRASLRLEELVPKEDGEALRQKLEAGVPFGYISSEIWSRQQLAELDYYSIQRELVRVAGSMGYSGKTGLYTHTRHGRGELNLEFFRNVMLNASFGESARRFQKINETSHSARCSDVAGEWASSSSSPWPWRSWGASPSTQTVSNCDGAACGLWCPPSASNTSYGPLPVFHFPAYESGWFEEIVHNNNMHAAFRYLDLSVADFVREVARSDVPFLFYFWTPTLEMARMDAHRVFLPQENDCGDHNPAGDLTNLGTWRCDVGDDQLLKLASANVRSDAPLVMDLISGFELTRGKYLDAIPQYSVIEDANLQDAGINDLLSHLGYLNEARRNASSDELIRGLACQWVRQNRHIWELWAQRSLPYYADVTIARVILYFVCVLCLGSLFVIGLWETFWLRSDMIRSRWLHFDGCCARRCRRRTPGEVASHPSGGTEDSSLGTRAETPRSSRANSRRMNQHKASREMLQKAMRRRSSPRNVKESSKESSTTAACRCLVDWGDTDFTALAEEKVHLRVERFGQASERVVVAVRAKDEEAMQGVHYKLLATECVFEPLQKEAFVPVQTRFVPDIGPSYASKRNFYVELEGVTEGDAELRRPRCMAVVHIKGDGNFLPHSHHTTADQMTRRWLWILYREDRRHFWLAAACRAYQAFHEVLVLILSQQVLLDYVLGQRHYPLAPLAVAMVIPSALLARWADREFVIFSNVGSISMRMRDLIWRKFWCLSMQAHFHEDDHRAKWLMALLRVQEATKAWLVFYATIEQLVRLFFSGVVIAISCTDWFRASSYTWPLVPLATLLVYFVFCIVSFIVIWKGGFAQAQARTLDKCEDQLDELVKQFVWTLTSWPVITSDKPTMSSLGALSEHARDVNKEYTKLVRHVWLGEQTAAWIGQYSTYLFRVFLMYQGIMAVVDFRYHGQGKLTVGTFIALIKVVEVFGQTMTKVQTDMLDMLRAGAVLHMLADLFDMADFDRHLERHAAQHSGILDPADKERQEDSIQLQDVTFKYSWLSQPVIRDCSMEIPLGHSYLLTGPRNGGKLTLMRLLVGHEAMKLSGGRLRAPGWLRVCLLDGMTNFIPGLSMLDHVLIGGDYCDRQDPFQVIIRALPILNLYRDSRRTLFSTSMMDSAEKSGEESESSSATPPDGAGSASITATGSVSLAALIRAQQESVTHLTVREQFVLHLARALLRDPDLLLVNLRGLAEDIWTERLYVILCLWQVTGGLDGLVRELLLAEEEEEKGSEPDEEGAQILRGASNLTEHEADRPVVSLEALVRRLEAARERQASTGEGGPACLKRTLVVLSMSVKRLRRFHSHAGMSKVIHLHESGQWSVADVPGSASPDRRTSELSEDPCSRQHTRRGKGGAHAPAAPASPRSSPSGTPTARTPTRGSEVQTQMPVTPRSSGSALDVPVAHVSTRDLVGSQTSMSL